MINSCCIFTNTRTSTSGIWYSNNCGRKKAYVCKKEKGSDTPIDPIPTDSVPGYCPDGWFGLGVYLYFVWADVSLFCLFT